MQIAHKEGYSATATDLSALVTKLRRAQPDIIVHAGYNPDITLFLRQSKEAGLKFMALIGDGAGYGQIDKLRETFKDDVNYFHNVDPVASQLLDPKTLQPGVGEITAEMVKRYKAETGARRGAAAHLDGLQPGLDLPDRRAAARHQEVRRIRRRGSAQGSARYRHPARRHHPGLWREVLPGRHTNGRAERALLAGRDAVRRRARPRSPGRSRSAPPTRCCRCPPATPTRAE